MTLQTKTGKGRKMCRTDSGDRRIQRLCKDHTIESSGCTQSEMAQTDVMLSAKYFLWRLREFSLSAKIPIKSHFYLSIKD